ncbi:carbonic anhydrase [Cognatiyoonia sp. IB215182]|uniref:carbonic anhydrase n=1 Tax=Cognatiyoonia sp. IB215182 TaxID=3097353 RepID=UPI002A146227|nr:carbonic anhydrase [Cognatiyoonia sp. IB215182]MDX8350837.1 carbonic anhydrase [Cognatiyoonia sp. IB215182]
MEIDMTLTMKENTSVDHQTARRSHEAEALVLNCMDYRLISAVTDYLDARGLTGKYDQISLAGGAIGVMADEAAPWAETFWAHVKLARQLHGIKRVIIIDHRDCGACKAFVGQDCADDSDREQLIHMRTMEALADEVRTREPGLAVEVLLMDLDGSVQRLDG